ncbi:MAG: PE family protein, partial [Corynebacterium flavescens]
MAGNPGEATAPSDPGDDSGTSTAAGIFISFLGGGSGSGTSANSGGGAITPSAAGGTALGSGSG